MPDIVNLHLPLAADAELRAVDALDSMLARHRVEERAAGQARHALVEACLNAIEYSTPSLFFREMDVSIALDESGELRITVANPGQFRRRNSEPRRGHGFKIMTSFMDRVHFQKNADGTRIEMIKRVGTQN